MASKRTPRRRRHALLALPRAVLLPGEVRAVDLAHERDKSALGHAATSAGERVLVIVAGEEDEPQARALPEIGTLARVLRHEETADGAVRVLLEGLGRVRLSDSTFERGCLWVRTEPASSGGAAEPVPRGQRELVLGAGAYAIHPTDRAAAGLPLGHAERLQLLASCRAPRPHLPPGRPSPRSRARSCSPASPSCATSGPRSAATWPRPCGSSAGSWRPR